MNVFRKGLLFVIVLALSLPLCFCSETSEETLPADGDSDKAADGDSDGAEQGDMDSEPTNEDIVKAIVEEMTAGRMARSVEAMQEKTFVHFSDDYLRAGLDKEGQIAKELSDLADNPWMQFDNYTLTLEVDIQGTQATVTTQNEIKGTISAHDDLENELAFSGTLKGKGYLVLEEDGLWRATGGESLFHEYKLEGGADEYKPDLSGVSLNKTSIAPGELFSISGSFDMPQIEGDVIAYMDVSLSFMDERNNAEYWINEEEIILQTELNDYLGGNFSFDFAMPNEGNPQGMVIPDTLPLGEDALEVLCRVYVFDSEYSLLAMNSKVFILPLRPYKNAEICLEKESKDIDGLWLLSVEHETIPKLNTLQIADIRQVGEEIYGLVAYANTDDENKNVIIPVEIFGSMKQNQMQFSYSSENFSFAYKATMQNDLLLDGTVDYTINGNDVQAQFGGKKVSQRCTGLGLDQMNGTSIDLNLDGTHYNYDLSVDYIEASLLAGGSGESLSGYAVRNVLVATDDDTSGRWLLLSFDDDEGGVAVMREGDDILEGSFTVE